MELSGVDEDSCFGDGAPASDVLWNVWTILQRFIECGVDENKVRVKNIYLNKDKSPPIQGIVLYKDDEVVIWKNVDSLDTPVTDYTLVHGSPVTKLSIQDFGSSLNWGKVLRRKNKSLLDDVYVKQGQYRRSLPKSYKTDFDETCHSIPWTRLRDDMESLENVKFIPYGLISFQMACSKPKELKSFLKPKEVPKSLTKMPRQRSIPSPRAIPEALPSPGPTSRDASPRCRKRSRESSDFPGDFPALEDSVHPSSPKQSKTCDPACDQYDPCIESFIGASKDVLPILVLQKKYKMARNLSKCICYFSSESNKC